MVRIFDIENGKVIPTEHCYTIKWLNVINEKYKENATKVFAYLFYMSYTGDFNPYNNFSKAEREVLLPKDLGIDFSLDDVDILNAIERLEGMYMTPPKVSFEAMKAAMNEITKYIRNVKVIDGRDGNLDGIMKVMNNYSKLRQAFNEAYKDMKEDEDINVRGDQELAYDQM